MPEPLTLQELFDRWQDAEAGLISEMSSQTTTDLAHLDALAKATAESLGLEYQPE